MKTLDSSGSKLCSFQAKIFTWSLLLECSSPVFLRRFFFSDFARKLDEAQGFQFSYDVDDCFTSVVMEYGESRYGKTKLSEKELYWLGYITRYFCYTREYPSKLLYKTIPLKLFIENYEVYHTQSEEWVIERILTAAGLDEKYFDKTHREKEILTRLWT